MVNPQCLVDAMHSENAEMESDQYEDPWHWWNTLRSTADFSNKLSIALELSATIPSKQEIGRWQGIKLRKKT